MNKIFLFLILSFLSFPKLHAEDEIYYVSPGIGLSWNFSGQFILSPKLSIGMLQNIFIYNITFGWALSKADDHYPYYYIEAQTGSYDILTRAVQFPLCTGLGIGVAFHTSGSQTKTYFKASVFTGFFLFARASFIYDNEWYPDIGLEPVIPLPLSQISIGVD